MCAIAQFRTCLWPCVGRWASGQEAGQPPGARSPDPGSQTWVGAVAAPNTLLAAGGETGAPRSQRGTRPKATTERAFLVSSTLQRSTPKRLVHSCQACGPGSPAPIQGIT